MAMAAGAFEEVFYRTDATVRADVIVKWRVIQANIADLGEDALRDLLADVMRMYTSHGNAVTVEMTELIDSWYRRALFVAADRRDPVDPESDRWIPVDRTSGF